VVLSIPKGARVLSPVPVTNMETDLVAAITNQGKMLVIPVSEIPMLAKGKGNKIIGIPSAKVASREEFVQAIACVPEGGQLVIHAGKRHLSLKPADLEHYQGERGRRGSKLPRGLQRVDKVAVES
jgi:topoisomerase-4 subunit A